MFGVRFSFVATRSGMTRVRHYNADDIRMKKEALAFAKKHASASDETYYARTVDYNMLINDTATLIQVPFNTHQKIADCFSRFEMDQVANYEAAGASQSLNPSGQSEVGNLDGLRSARLSVKEMDLFEKLELLANSSLHVIATQSVISNEGTQRAVAAVVGVFYDYASFALRLLNTTNAQFNEGARALKKPAHCYLSNSSGPDCDETKTVRCGHLNDTIDCLLIDNNGYIVFSEDLSFIGRHLHAYDPAMMARLVSAGVYHEINITDYQSICIRQEERQTASSASSRGLLAFLTFIHNFFEALIHLWAITLTIIGSYLSETASAQGQTPSQPSLQPMLSLLPNKTYLRPCDRVLTRYETRPGLFSSDLPEYYTTRCNCPAWFVYEQVPKTNLIMVIADTISTCRSKCETAGMLLDSVDDTLKTHHNVIGTDELQVCSMFDRESRLYKKKLDTCFSHHPEEEHIKLCGAACKSTQVQHSILIVSLLFSWLKIFSRL